MARLLLALSCLLLITGCDPRAERIAQASQLDYDYPQLGLQVELSYSGWKGRPHPLESISITADDHAYAEVPVSLSWDGPVVMDYPSLRAWVEEATQLTPDHPGPQFRKGQVPTHSVQMTYDHQAPSPKDGPIHGFTIACQPPGQPLVLRLRTKQGTITIDCGADKAAHIQTLGQPTAAWFPYRRRSPCL